MNQTKTIIFALSNRDKNNPLTPIAHATVTRETIGNTEGYQIVNRSGEKLSLDADCIGPLIRALLELKIDNRADLGRITGNY
jgi:hypothetical protein